MFNPTLIVIEAFIRELQTMYGRTHGYWSPIVLHQAGSEGSAFSHAITAWLASFIASCVSRSLSNSLHTAFSELAASSRKASRILLLSRRVEVAVFARFAPFRRTKTRRFFQKQTLDIGRTILPLRSMRFTSAVRSAACSSRLNDNVAPGWRLAERLSSQTAKRLHRE